MKMPKTGQNMAEMKYERPLRKLAPEKLSPYLFMKNFLGGGRWDGKWKAVTTITLYNYYNALQIVHDIVHGLSTLYYYSIE